MFSKSTQRSKSAARDETLRWRIWAIAYLLLFLTIMLLAYQGKLPTGLTQHDKFAHFFLYGMATFLGQKLLHDRKFHLAGRSLPLFPVLFGIFTTVEELCQGLSPNRSLDWGDLLASFLGIAIGYGLTVWQRSSAEK
jgi:VanZ family protein